MIEAILAFFSSAVKFIANIGRWLLDHPKILAGLIVAAVLAFSAWRIHTIITDLREANAELVESNTKLSTENIQLKSDIMLATEANTINERIIKSLQIDANSLSALIAKANAGNISSKAQLEALEKKLLEMSESGNGPVGDILREAIRSIQASRVERQK
jgi:hypothetical protein